MKRQIVYYEKRFGTFTDSETIARLFGIRNKDVIAGFERLLKDYPELATPESATFTSEKLTTPSKPTKNQDLLRRNLVAPNIIYRWRYDEREYRGQKYKCVELNKPMFTLLVMRFKTKRARKAQLAFNTAFYELETQNIKLSQNLANDQWKLQREQSKLVHRNLTDAVKLFVDYATEQGSQNARTFYKHYQNAIYKALKLTEHNRPNLKETLDQMETWQLTTAESHAQQRLLVYMEQGEHYKVIYQLVKTDIEKLADTLMVPFNTYPPKIPSN